MRLSLVLSFVLALILAGLAVLGVRTYLSSERQQIMGEQAKQTHAQQDQEPKNTIVVATELLSFGERVTPQKLREIDWAADIRPEGSFSKVADLVTGDGDDAARFALTNIAVGEPVLASRVTIPGQRAKLSTALGEGKKAISIRVNDVLGVAGFVLPGDRVDVLLTRGGPDGNFVDVLLQGLKVLAIDQNADDSKDQPKLVRTVTFEVSTQEAQKLVLASRVGTLSLALRNVSSTEVETIDRVTLSDLSDADIAESLEKAKMEALQEEALRALEEARKSAEVGSLQRLGELEALLKDLSTGIAERLDDVEEQIQTQEPVILEREVIVEKEVVVEPAKPQSVVAEDRPSTRVGVIRNGKRSEYKVEPTDQLEFQADDGDSNLGARMPPSAVVPDQEAKEENAS